MSHLNTLTGGRRTQTEPKTRTKTHQIILRNESWYGDGSPNLGSQFNSGRTIERSAVLVDILANASKRERKRGNKRLAQAYQTLQKKFHTCRPRRRCGSLGCPQCARAFQRARVTAQYALINDLAVSKSGKKLVMVTIVPLDETFKPEELENLDIRGRARWLKDRLKAAGFNRVTFGAADISWESSFYQLHWHLAMWTSKASKLTARLRKVFPGKREYDRPVLVKKTTNLNFLRYSEKVINLPDLLRNNRSHLPELLMALDRHAPLDVMLLTKVRVSTTDSGLVITPVNPSKRNGRRATTPTVGHKRTNG